MRKRFLSVLLFSGFIYIPLQSMAWGMLGHRIVAEIASSYLTSKARSEINRILGTESMAGASNWADFIKSDSTYRYLNSWHYVNFPKDLTYDQMQQELKKDTATDAYTKLNFLIRELRKKNISPDKKQLYLRLLIHIVGDIHQPLHVSAVGTTGGNDIKLTWFTTPSNLHRVWDEHLIEYQQLSYTEYAREINHTTLAQRKAWQQQPLTRWLYDSYVIAGQLHTEITGDNPKLSYRYNFDHIAQLNRQLLLGGVHLAGLLNEIFGN